MNPNAPTCSVANIVHSVFVQEMQYVTDHILDSAAKNHRVVDFHDLMYKFTLDSFVL